MRKALSSAEIINANSSSDFDSHERPKCKKHLTPSPNWSVGHLKYGSECTWMYKVLLKMDLDVLGIPQFFIFFVYMSRCTFDVLWWPRFLYLILRTSKYIWIHRWHIHIFSEFFEAALKMDLDVLRLPQYFLKEREHIRVAVHSSIYNLVEC